ncbi:MAG: nitroreductase family protein [Limosilactobacillus sp.]
MEFKDTVEKRRSIRDFSDRPVSKEDLTSLINLAKQAPSWANSQTWKVIIATGQTLEEIRTRHAEAVGKGLAPSPEIPLLHREEMGIQGAQNVSKWMGDIHQFMQSDRSAMAKDSAHLFNAPAVAYLLVPANPSLWETYDLGAFGQTLMLAAADKGIDSIPAMEFVQYSRMLHDVLGVSRDYIFAVGIGLGYRKTDALINQFASARMDNNDFLTILE